jgi:hypothetical protein
MRKLLVAAALMLTAAGASASNFRGADQVYIPIAGHAAGASGLFISDVYLANLTPDTVTVSAIYQPVNTPTDPSNPATIGQNIAGTIELAPFQRKEIKDFFPNGLGVASGFGLVILNGCKKGADCGPATQDEYGYSPNFRAISAESRIYSTPNPPPNNPPTTGQLFSGIPWYNFVSENQASVGLDKVFITGVTHTGTQGAGTFRTNFGFINASQYSSTTLAVTLFKGGTAAANKVAENVVNLTPLENKQVNFPGLFPNAPLGGDYFVVVEQRNSTAIPGAPTSCVKGCPAYLAYGSVLDNQTGDATTLEAQYMVELTGAALDIIYPSSAGKDTYRRAVRH